jgi:hypothetical protein
MAGEVKLVAILTAIVFILLGPTAVYLMSFQHEGMAGDISYYVGLFILLPASVVHRILGATLVSVLVGLLAQFFWFLAWVAAGRWYHVRKQKAAKTTKPA